MRQYGYGHQTITVDDNTPPTITAPAAITGIQCVAAVPAAYADASAFTAAGGTLGDNCVGAVTVAMTSETTAREAVPINM